MVKLKLNGQITFLVNSVELSKATIQLVKKYEFHGAAGQELSKFISLLWKGVYIATQEFDWEKRCTRADDRQWPGLILQCHHSHWRNIDFIMLAMGWNYTNDHD